MIDVSNRVRSNVKSYISDMCECVQNDNRTPTSFPAVRVKQIDNSDVAVDLENSENAVRSVIEIQAFSNKNLTESTKIIHKACDAMRIMGYERNYGPTEIKNASDTNIYRMVARFRRIVSSVDEIEKFVTEKV